MMNLLRGNNRSYGLGLEDDWLRDFFASPYSSSQSMMKTDIKEEDSQYILVMDVPGFQKQDIKISLESGYLTIEAKKETSNDEKDRQGNYIRRERIYGSCSRSFYVGDLKENSIQASYEQGMLTVRIPKDGGMTTEAKRYISIE